MFREAGNSLKKRQFARKITACLLACVTVFSLSGGRDSSAWAAETISDTQVVVVDDVTEVAELVEQMDQDRDLEPDANDYQTCRIVVMTDTLKDDFGASSVIACPEYGEYVLQYDTIAQTRNAYRSLLQIYDESRCWVDQVLEVQEMEAVYRPEAWGTSALGMDVLKGSDYFNGNGSVVLQDTVTVAVIDTGCSTSHPAFAGRISPYSYNFADGTDQVYDRNKQHTSGHGTMVCSIVADATPENVDIMVLQVANENGWTYSLKIANAMLYAMEHGADVINMSLGIDDANCSEWDYMLEQLYESGIPFVAAAGNDGKNVAEVYPAFHEKTIAVSAVDQYNAFCSFSNYGDKIDFCAPGYLLKVADSLGDSTGSSGTSLSAPFIASEIAYIKMLHPDASVDEIYDTLKAYAVDLGPAGKDSKFGWGIPMIGSYLEDELSVSEGSDTSVCGQDMTWSLDQGVLMISGSGRMYQYAKDKFPWSAHSDEITAVKISSGVQDLAQGALAGCKNLSEIIVDSGNTWLWTDGTCLYTADQSELLAVVPACEGTLSIPASVLRAYALYGCANLTEVILKADNISIGTEAFAECTSLSQVYIWGDLNSIGNKAFASVRATVFREASDIRGSKLQQAYGGSLKWKHYYHNAADWIITYQDTWNYSGKAIRPQITVSSIGDVEPDYTVTYSSNKNAGTAKIVVKGTGLCAGSQTLTFRIRGKAQKLSASISASRLDLGKSALITASAKGKITYQSSAPGVAKVSLNGKVTAKTPGVATITVSAAAKDGYEPAVKKITVKVLPPTPEIRAWSNSTRGITLRWNAVSSVSGYQIYRNDVLVGTITNGKAVSWTDTAAKTSGQKYTYKLYAVKDGVSSRASAVKTIYYMAYPTISKLSFPGGNQIVLEWKSNAKASGYEVQCSAKEDFSSQVKKYNLQGSSVTNVKISSLTKGRTYYIRIRSYKTVNGKKYCSSWGVTWVNL